MAEYFVYTEDQDARMNELDKSGVPAYEARAIVGVQPDNTDVKPSASDKPTNQTTALSYIQLAREALQAGTKSSHLSPQ